MFLRLTKLDYPYVKGKYKIYTDKYKISGRFW